MAILSILAVIGKILLVLLLILAIVILLILLVPITYKAKILKQDDTFKADGNVGWLLHAVHFSFSFDIAREDEKLKLDLRFLGIPLMPLIRKITKNGKKKPGKKKKGQDAAPEREIRWEAPRKPTVEPGQRRAAEPEVVPSKHPTLIQRISAHIMAFFGKVKKAFRKLLDISKNIAVWIDYLQSDSFDRAKDCLLTNGKAILRHVLPRRISGKIAFGMKDPSTTGMIYGLSYILYPAFPEKLDLEPDFEESRFDADVTVNGHIQLIVLVFRAVRILLQKDVRKLISRIRKQAGKNSKDKE